MPDLLAETLNDPAVGAVGTAVVLAGIALWLAAAWWAYADAARRTESSLAGFVAAGWIILSTPLLLPLSLAAYAFARPQVAALPRTERCYACHTDNGAVDNTFVQFYPTLLEVATKMGTVKPVTSAPAAH